MVVSCDLEVERGESGDVWKRQPRSFELEIDARGTKKQRNGNTYTHGWGLVRGSHSFELLDWPVEVFWWC